MRKPRPGPPARELEALRARLREAEEVLEAIRGGEIDALVVAGPSGEALYRLKGADYTYVFEHSQLGESITRPSGELTVNDAFCRMLGYSRDELESRSWMEITHPDDIESTRREIGTMLSGERDSARFVKRYLHKDGSTVWAEVSTSLRRDEKGRPVYFITSVNDITQRHHAEEALQASEIRYRRLFESAKDGILILDHDTGRIVDSNPFIEGLTGHTKVELKGKTLWEIGMFSDSAASKVAFAELQAKAYIRLEDLPLRDAAGNPVDVEFVSNTYLVNDTKVIQCNIRDISERRRAEDRIKRLNRLLTTIREVNELIVRVDDREALLLKICQTFVELGGFRMAWIGFEDPGSGRVVPAARAGDGHEYLDGVEVRTDDLPEGRGPTGTAIRTGQHVFIPDLADACVAPWRERMLAYGFQSMGSFPIRVHKNVLGALVIQQGVSMTLGDEEIALLDEVAGDLGYALEAFDNRDGRRRAEEALAKSEFYYRSLIESSVDITAVITAEGDFSYVSPSVDQVLGYKPGDVSGLSVFDLIHPEHRELVVDRIRQTLERGSNYEQVEFPIRHRDGSWRTLSIIGRSLPPETELRGVIISARDITDQRELEAQFQAAQKMEAVGRLAGGIAHDFNNLLTAILGYSEMMEEQLPNDEDLRSSLREIHHAGERAAALTRQLLAFSRRQVLQLQLLDLNAVVSEVDKLLRRLIGEDVKLVTQLDPALGTVKADPGQLEQVLMNLAVNARDAMPEGGTLTIETTNAVLDASFVAGHPGARSGEYVVLTVTDTGIGMSEEVRSRAFEPFFTTKGPGKGTGLGLATVYGLVKQVDGYIALESELGRGTTFRIHFPREAGPASLPHSGEQRALLAHGTETILLVEDESGVRRLSHTILENHGYTVLEAESGESALEIVRSRAEKIHLVVTDVIMPGMSGRELWNRLRVLRPTARVLFMSGYTDDAIVRQGVLEPGIEFLQKPFTPHSLAEKVREVLDRP